MNTDTEATNVQNPTPSEKPLSIESLMDELNSFSEQEISDFGNELDDIDTEKKVLTEAPPSAKRFFMLSRRYINLANEIVTELRNKAVEYEFLFSESNSEKAKTFFETEIHPLVHQRQEYNEKAKVFRDLAWACCYDKAGRTCKGNIGLSKDWRLVEKGGYPLEVLDDLISVLFGD